VTVIAHVVRAFEDADVIREGSVSPMDDYQTIQTELIIADLSRLNKAAENRKAEQVKKDAIHKLTDALDTGMRAYDVEISDEEKAVTSDLFLLTNKPEIIVLNVSEQDYSEVGIQKITEKYSQLLNQPADKCVVICAKIESELASLTDEEQAEYLSDLGLKKSGLERLIQKAYAKLGLISFLTAGEKEVRAWTTRVGATAPEAAGEIHTDFIKKFIKAEVISFVDYITLGGRKKARELGKARLEGKDYIVQDGDVIEFKIGA
jgi:GTP-binding protein YchF